MEARNTIQTMTAMLVGIVAAAGISLVAVDEARAVVRACCLPNGTCEMLNRSTCEDQQGGMSEAPGTDCSMVECPLLCSGSAPACNGECPPGDVCVVWIDSGLGTTSAPVGQCGCTPEIPAGGACNPLADACAPGLACVNGVCAPPVARAPALSPMGLAALGGILVALGGVRLLRRRAAV